MTKISVVIPSHQGRERLEATLAALSSQTVEGEDFEVIVVVDGGDSATFEAAESVPASFDLRIYSQPHSGAGIARNMGAQLARAKLLLFLDDDMIAAPNLLVAHLGVHAERPGHVVLGLFTQAKSKSPDGLLVNTTKLWWDHHFSELARQEHRFNYKDLCTGNVSISKELFFEVGGFSGAFYGKAGEDYEFGIRLIKRAIPFLFAQAAVTVHSSMPTTKGALRRAYEEGRGNVVIARMHPDIAPSLLLSNAVEDGPWIQFGPRHLRLRGWMTRAIPVVLLPVAAVMQKLKMRSLWKRAFGLLHSCAYWRGVFDELGSEDAFRALLQDLVLKPEPAREVTLDLVVEIDRLDQILPATRPDAVNLLYDQLVVGRISPIPGAEPLRAIHVRHALIERFAYNLALAMALAPGGELTPHEVAR